MKKNIFVILVLGIIFILLFNLNIGIKINTFSNLPVKLTGGGCVYYPSNNLEKDKFLFVNDYGEYGYAVINNTEQEFKLKKYDIDNNIYEYKNDKYIATIHITESKSLGDESSTILGNLEVSKIGGKSDIKDIIGECGS